MTSRSQPVRTPTGLDYGKAGQIQDAQRVIPLPDNRSTGGATPGPSGPPAGGGAPVVDVFGETARPNEPATTGAAVGAGSASTEPMLPAIDPGVEQIRALILNGYGSPGLRRLLEFASRRSM